MSATKREIWLILCGVAAFVLGIIVQIGPRPWHERLLAIGLVVGGISMIVVALPTKNGD